MWRRGGWVPCPLAPDGRGGPCPASKSYFRCTVQEIKHEKILADRRLSLSLFFLALSLVLAQWVFNPMKHLRARECLRRRGRHDNGEKRGRREKLRPTKLPSFHSMSRLRRAVVASSSLFCLPPSLLAPLRHEPRRGFLLDSAVAFAH